LQLYKGKCDERCKSTLLIVVKAHFNNNNLYSPSRQKQYTEYKRVKNYKTERKTVG